MTAAVTALGVVITTIGVVYNVPFTYRVLRTKSAQDIDPWFLMLRILNSILTLAYGALLKDPYIISTNAIPLVSSAIVLYIRSKRSKPNAERLHGERFHDERFHDEEMLVGQTSEDADLNRVCDLNRSDDLSCCVHQNKAEAGQ